MLDLPVVLANGKSRKMRDYNFNRPRIRNYASEGGKTLSLENHRKIPAICTLLGFGCRFKTIQICLAGIPFAADFDLG